MCLKHWNQMRRYGKILDTNPRTVYDSNEVRIYEKYAEVDTYTSTGEVKNTFKIDVEDVKLLQGKKWRTVLKGKQKAPYLVTGHANKRNNDQVYFHRLIMGNPNEEIDHINRDSTDNRKSNLRLSNRAQQVTNTRLRVDSTQGVKGVYFIQSKHKYRAEIEKGDIHIYSKLFTTKEEAAYIRYKLEQTFYSEETDMYNTPLLLELSNTLSDKKKEELNNYLKNKLKDWVEMI